MGSEEQEPKQYLVPEFKRELVHFAPEEVRVEIGWANTRVPNPSESEINACPDRFRCFSCQAMKGKKHFAGLVARQRICDTCYPFVDERAGGGLVRFDERHGFPVRD